MKLWNEVELDAQRDLDEQPRLICGAHLARERNGFALVGRHDPQGPWVLELIYARGFQPYYPGTSCALNPLRSVADIRRLVLHWSGNGEQAFAKCLEAEHAENRGKEEWTEYRG